MVLNLFKPMLLWLMVLLTNFKTFAQTTVTLPTQCASCSSVTVIPCTAPTALVCDAAATISAGGSATSTVTGGTGGTITWAITPTTGVSTTSGSGATTSAITFATAGTYTVTFTSTNSSSPAACSPAAVVTCTRTITVNAAIDPSTNGTAIVSAYGGAGCTGSGTISGTMTAGTAVSGVTMTLYANVTTLGTWSLSAVSNGVTFSGSGTFTTLGCQAITLNASGTPTTAGVTTWTTNATPAASVTATVAAPITIPSTITLARNKYYMVASVYDQDYLPYTAPTGAATTATSAADGSNDPITINVQGTITTTAIALKIPVTATGSGTLPAFTQTINIPASFTEDGISRNLTLSWASQAYTAATKTITASLVAVGGTLNAKKLDLQTGIGNDALGVLMGSFTFPYNNAGATTTYGVRVIAGVPDKMMGVADNTGSTTSHLMLYLPVMGEDGNIWLNNNLGADYANVNKATFNLAQQATSGTDFNAYGSLIQWGRKPDGHELMNWTSPTTGTSVNGTVAAKSNAPTHASFITTSSFDDWRVTQDNTLWATEASANNPCPYGYRVPTNAETSVLISNATNSAFGTSSALKFTFTGVRYYHGGLGDVNAYGYYWTSSVNAGYAINVFFAANNLGHQSAYRVYGSPVRCIKD